MSVRRLFGTELIQGRSRVIPKSMLTMILVNRVMFHEIGLHSLASGMRLTPMSLRRLYRTELIRGCSKVVPVSMHGAGVRQSFDVSQNRAAELGV